MSDTVGTSPAEPLSYDATPARCDSVFSLIALAVAIVSVTVPAFMTYQILTGRRHQFAVYRAYLNEQVNVAGRPISLYANWPWYAFDSVAMLFGLIGIYRGRPRFGWIAFGIAAASMAGKMTIVLGSPW